MKRFKHPRLLSQLKPGDCFTYPKDQVEWTVIASGKTSAVITDGKDITSDLNCKNVILLKGY